MGPDGTLYIADTGQHRIRKVDTNGIITTIAGLTGQSGFIGDGGPASSARLNTPYGLALGPDGSLYIADTINYRVRRVGPDGIITTVAGTSIQCGSIVNNYWVYVCGDGGPASQAQLCWPYRTSPWGLRAAFLSRMSVPVGRPFAGSARRASFQPCYPTRPLHLHITMGTRACRQPASIFTPGKRLWARTGACMSRVTAMMDTGWF